MTAGFGFVIWQKRAGLVAMVLLVAALLSLADALVGGFRGGGGLIELLPGDHYLISGPLPPRTEAIRDFVIDGQPDDGSVRLIPKTIFSGYWFGGSMWRGAIEVDPHAQEGHHVFRVKDPYGEKQNPALVFNVRVWPDQATLNAHSPSLLTRLTGVSPFVVAVAFALGGIAGMAANFLFGRLWARHLHTHHCGEIYKLRQTERGTEITCELHCGRALQPGMDGAVYRPSGELLGAAKVINCENGEVLLLISQSIDVRLGDVACVQVESKQNGSERGSSAV
ncbi:hypothetical protein Despr_2860 [Desulfobulbus propionicus DSM 2032]|jgi:hypothetical protein|uniref:Uncharacterized protein n=1 Tax=Desulfobulbus propionicus (strain ATCC 33891 / DSM 2032 / VKM B-1956 / 1pr3) TaxID=577650 RepID=A0A7U3YP64_DESPD|nr:hypothetical protein [Desulfobulbus propionicus]ADW18994.1 hypothetical protein Despr_2860 [Desulfobulbus propionicus DSM 2032]